MGGAGRGAPGAVPQAGEGHDPQLERAVAMTLQLLEKNPPPTPKRPEYPNYQRPTKPAAGAGSGGR